MRNFLIADALTCRWDQTCLTGFEKRYGGFVSSFLFATETQQTIGAPPSHLLRYCLACKVL